jgi:AmmeMemoRadiSam system protein B
MASAKCQSLEVNLLHACNSGDTAGKPNRVVGYAAFALR